MFCLILEPIMVKQSNFFKKFNLKEIHCFEASPINFEILKKNLKNLDIKQDIYLNNIGAGEKKINFFKSNTRIIIINN